jgi:Tol biopolymer transport system component/C-terminal processing protease CtpA/Prc
MKKVLIFKGLLFFSLLVHAAEPVRWLRYPSISPDGKTIVFSYKGDLYKVSSTGGEAEALTLSEGHDFMPVWSPDGKRIAFASDRYGNYDVFVMNATGGAATRLTLHSSNDYPYRFSPDGKNIYFSSTRVDDVRYTQFPYGRLGEWYSVPVSGGRESQFLSIAAEDIDVDAKANRFLFHDKKGYEDPWRKHHTSSVARDIWMYDATTGKFTRLTNFAGEDRNPVWTQDGQSYWYLSEQSGSFNVWKNSVNMGSAPVQITRFDKNPVRFLSASDDDKLCFSYNGDIFVMESGKSPSRLEISILTDERYNPVRTETFSSGVTEMQVSPSGKEVVFVIRGEVFVTSVEGGTTRRITNTPGQERSVSFGPDGRSILYAAERDKKWGIYRTLLERSEEKYFFQSTLLKEETLVKGKSESFQPEYSPDGEEVAFLENRTGVSVLNIKSGKIRNILPENRAYSYSDGDQSFRWSPDGKYLLVHPLIEGNWIQQVALADAEGKNPLQILTPGGFDNANGKWMMNGQLMLWFSNRHGMKNVASHGNQLDAYGLFLTKDAWDKFNLNKDDAALLKEAEEKKDEKKTEKKDSSRKTEPVKIELEGLQDRRARLTIHSSALADAVVSPDGEKLYYLTRFEGGYDLWVTKFRDHETKMLLKLDAGGTGEIIQDKDGKNLYFVADGRMIRVNTEKTEKKEIGFSAELPLDAAAERVYLFEHMWRQVKEKFYVSDLQKTDWDYYKSTYEAFLPHINNNRDFAEMASELLGELNASHTGCRYSPSFKNPDITAHLGAYFDESYKGKGLKVAEILENGPLSKADIRVSTGEIIEKIDGNEILPETNYYAYLNRKADKYVLLTVLDEKTGKRRDISVKPLHPSQVPDLLYKRWVKRMQDMTDKLSGGQIGYMHVAGMNDESYREFYDQVMGKYLNRKALIVDTRFNGGGWLHDDLATFLSGKKYIEFVPRERKIGVEPGSKWIKPSIVLMGEGNYSDAHMFPVVYKTLGIGKLLGMPVPGTGTAVWWETLQDASLVFGIPQVGVVTLDGKYCENNQLMPDIQVENDYESMLKGQDPQLEAAVKELLKSK